MKNLVDTLLAEEWRHWSDQQPRYIRPLGGGMTNHSFLIQAGSDRLVLRINAAIAIMSDMEKTQTNLRWQ